jgi:hypothetical protein
MSSVTTQPEAQPVFASVITSQDAVIWNLAESVLSKAPESAVHMVVYAMEAVEHLNGLQGPEKAHTVLRILSHLVSDKMKERLPPSLSTIDIDLLTNDAFVLDTIQTIISATKGQIQVNVTKLVNSTLKKALEKFHKWNKSTSCKCLQ